MSLISDPTPLISPYKKVMLFLKCSEIFVYKKTNICIHKFFLDGVPKIDSFIVTQFKCLKNVSPLKGQKGESSSFPPKKMNGNFILRSSHPDLSVNGLT